MFAGEEFVAGRYWGARQAIICENQSSWTSVVRQVLFRHASYQFAWHERTFLWSDNETKRKAALVRSSCRAGQFL